MRTLNVFEAHYTFLSLLIYFKTMLSSPIKQISYSQVSQEVLIQINLFWMYDFANIPLKWWCPDETKFQI